MSDTFARVIARSIRAERSRRHWSQAALAEKVGTSQSTIAAIENGTRRVYAHELPEFCRALEVPLTVLLHGADEADLRSLGF